MNIKRLTPLNYLNTVFLTDAGLETDMVFNRGMELPEFAAHALLESEQGRKQLTDYFVPFLNLAADHDYGFVLDTQTWRAQRHFSEALKSSVGELETINRDAVKFVEKLRDEFGHGTTTLLSGTIGPCGDGYSPEHTMTAFESERYHAEQIGWLAETAVDMVTGLTITNVEEAIGIANAAKSFQVPVVISFTVETDGRLPSGEVLGHAIESVDQATAGYPAYYMVNCAHMDHFSEVLSGSWSTRVKGIRCNASRCSHEELDQSETLDAGDATEFGTLTAKLAAQHASLQVFGGCCGSDINHVRNIAHALSE